MSQTISGMNPPASKQELDDLKISNLVDAVPRFPAPALGTMGILHRIRDPKPTYTQTRNLLRALSDSSLGFGLVRYGGAQGPQMYRFEE